MVIQLLWTDIRSGARIKYTVPADVVIALGLVVVMDTLFFTTTSVVHTALSLFVLLFVPGYLLVATLFPRHGANSDLDDRRGRETAGGALRWPARVALSFAASLGLIPLTSIVLSVPFESLSPRVTLIGLHSLVLVGTVGAIIQRNRVPKTARFRLQIRRWPATLRTYLGARRASLDRVTAILSLVVVLAAVVTMGFVLLAPTQGEAYTSAALLTEQPDGSLEASGYPIQMEPDASRELVVRVQNHEGVESDYTLVGELQRVNTSGREPTVVESAPVLRASHTVAAGDVWEETHSVEPELEGENLRLRYYLYQGAEPTNTDAENAYRTLTLWVSITNSTG